MKRNRRLSLNELQSIFVMKRDGKTVREIEKRVQRSKSTISEATTKYRHPDRCTWARMDAYEKARSVYCQMQEKKKRGGRARKKRMNDPKIKTYVIEKLLAKAQWSPEVIAVRIGKDVPGKRICAKTIYTFIKRERRDLIKYLPQRGKKRRQRVMDRRCALKQGAPRKRSIEERPDRVNDRLELGHWEADTIVSKKNGSTYAVLSLRERVSRQRFFHLIPNLQAETTLAVIRAFLMSLSPQMRRSITFDNGSEFGPTAMYKLEEAFEGLKVYFCDSYSSWQKGAVENSNKELRWYFPKGTDFANVFQFELKDKMHRLNAKPMRCLGYQSSEEFFSKALAA